MLNILMKEREAYYINYLNLMSKKARDLLVAIASENGVDKPLSKDFLMKYKLGAASTIKSVIDLLIKKEAIFKKDDFIYIIDPLFSEWLKKFIILN